jgi:hypothetical protein
MSFLTGEDGTRNLPDRSCRTGLNPDLYFQTLYHINEQKKIMKKSLKKSLKKKLKIYIFFPIFKCPASGKENVQFPDSPDFEKLPDSGAGLDVR